MAVMNVETDIIASITASPMSYTQCDSSYD